MWVPADGAGTVTDKQVAPRLSLISALDTSGRVWAALTQANTNGDIMVMFLRYLVRQLERDDPLWADKTTILLDNAAWHRNPVIKERLAKMQLPIMYSGPYSYSTAPIELLFSALKLGELNPERLPTGKK